MIFVTIVMPDGTPVKAHCTRLHGLESCLTVRRVGIIEDMALLFISRFNSPFGIILDLNRYVHDWKLGPSGPSSSHNKQDVI